MRWRRRERLLRSRRAGAGRTHDRERTLSKVAFLGLGVMGYPMAGHLVGRGDHEVAVYNRTAAKSAAWVAKHGGSSAATPRAAAEGCDIVLALRRQ